MFKKKSHSQTKTNNTAHAVKSYSWNLPLLIQIKLNFKKTWLFCLKQQSKLQINVAFKRFGRTVY